MIIATANGEDYAIGCNNKLLAHIPADLRYFQKQTTNQVVLMGNNTMKSLQVLGMAKGLPNRHNIVLSRTHAMTPFLQDGEVTYINDVKSFLEWGTMYVNNVLEKDIWIIGGASVYEIFKDVVSEVHHTEINKSYPEADCHFNMKWVKNEEVFEQISEQVLCDVANVRVYKRL